MLRLLTCTATILLITALAAAQADYTQENWNDPQLQQNGWFYWNENNGQSYPNHHEPMNWQATGGIDNTGHVYTDAMTLLTPHHDETRAYYPAYNTTDLVPPHHINLEVPNAAIQVSFAARVQPFMQLDFHGGVITPFVDFLGSTVEILGGANTSQSDVTVSMAWRTRTTLEVDGTSFVPRIAGTDGDLHYAETSVPHDNDHALPPEGYNMVGDIVNLTGVVGPCVLQSDYAESTIVYDPGETEASPAARGWIFPGWLETDGRAGDLVGVDEWANAVDGNFTVGGRAVPHYLGSWSAFVASQGGGPLPLGEYVGSWGVDIVNDNVWAVVDHASTYGAIPEPSTVSLCAGRFRREEAAQERRPASRDGNIAPATIRKRARIGGPVGVRDGSLPPMPYALSPAVPPAVTRRRSCPGSGRCWGPGRV